MRNVLERLHYELPRQTNGCGGYHNSFQTAVLQSPDFIQDHGNVKKLQFHGLDNCNTNLE